MNRQDDTRPRRTEPDTSIEPEPYPGEPPPQDSTRRVVNVASHAGVATTAAASVLAAQRVSGSDDTEHTAASLDVFTEAGDAEPRGISAAAEPVTPAGGTPESPPPIPGNAETIPAPLPSVEFVASASIGGGVLEMAVDFSTPEENAQDDPDHYQHDDPDRETLLAGANVEIGGGFVPEDGADHSAMFGASGEIGGLPIDDVEAPDDENEDFAAAP
jgi:hypothetical protein